VSTLSDKKSIIDHLLGLNAARHAHVYTAYFSFSCQNCFCQYWALFVWSGVVITGARVYVA